MPVSTEPHEVLEDRLPLVWRHTGTVVGDAQHDLRREAPHLYAQFDRAPSSIPAIWAGVGAGR